jgi:hypothetical protein
VNCRAHAQEFESMDCLHSQTVKEHVLVLQRQ